MVARLIQQDIPLGARVTFALKTGKEVSGTLTALAQDHVRLDTADGPCTILVEQVGVWTLLKSTDAPITPPEPSRDSQDLARPELAPTEAKEFVPPASSPGSVTIASPVDVAPTLPAEAPETAAKRSDEEPALPREVLKTFLEIETRFQTKFDTVSLRPPAPSFQLFPKDLPECERNNWERVRSKYDYAARMNELGSKFGRVAPLVSDARALLERNPRSARLFFYLGYFLELTDRSAEAIEAYKRAAALAAEPEDWLRVANLASRSGDEPLTCFSLSQFFRLVKITQYRDEWYLYSRLTHALNDYREMETLLRTGRERWDSTEFHFFLESVIFFTSERVGERAAQLLICDWMNNRSPEEIALTALRGLPASAPESLELLRANFRGQVRSELDRHTDADSPASDSPPASRTTLIRTVGSQVPREGQIINFLPDRGFGFVRDSSGRDYFFHQRAVTDQELAQDLAHFSAKNKIAVYFEPTEGPRGPCTNQVYQRRGPDELFAIANKYANEGLFNMAVSYVRKLLAINPQSTKAQQAYDKWREFARIAVVPKGSNPYARAKRVQLLEKDLKKAVPLFKEAIRTRDNTDAAVKDLAHVLAQMGDTEEAIKVVTMNISLIENKDSAENVLLTLYQSAGHYQQTIVLLRKKLSAAPTEAKRTELLSQIAFAHLRAEDYATAEKVLRDVLSKRPDLAAVQRNLALCLSKQGRFIEAEDLLNHLLDTMSDNKALELLEVIRRAKTTGKPGRVDEIIIEAALSDLSGEVSPFARFFLDKSALPGVDPEKVRVGSVGRADISKLEDVATQLGTRLPRDRAAFLLSAAKLIPMIQEDIDQNLFYKYLGRSLVSSGDAAIAENRPIDSARELYAEALSIYDGVRTEGDEQDAVNALVRYLYGTMGQNAVPVGPKVLSINEAVESVFNIHPQPERVLDAVADLILRSRYAAQKLLNRLFTKVQLRAMSLEYLSQQGIRPMSVIERMPDFVDAWNELRRKRFEETRTIASELRFLANIELTTASLNQGIQRATSILGCRLLPLDQQRVRQLRSVLETALDMCKQVLFEEIERLCLQIQARCQSLSREIEEGPTKLSIEELLAVTNAIELRVRMRLEELWETATPQIELRLPVESYVPNSDSAIDLQIALANKLGRGPAESLELIVQPDDEYFSLRSSEVQLGESLRGNDQKIIEVQLRVTEQAIAAQTFSVTVFATYRTRSGEPQRTVPCSFSIRLYPESAFEAIPNPYTPYAEGGVVGDEAMFFGRGELLNNILAALLASKHQSKCIVVYGQMRAGKSSILHHLKRKLEEHANLMVVDIENIGSILDEAARVPLLYQILWQIYRGMRSAIEGRVATGLPELDLPHFEDTDFYSHPAPLQKFKDTLDGIRQRASRSDGWRDVRTVLLVDEFSYIHRLIVGKKLPETFMINWKAVLQGNYFHAVLAGQDVMPRFKQRFSNEFGTTQDERVSYLKKEDAIRLIDEPIRIGGANSRYRERARERILDLSAGSPFYTQIICSRLVEYMNRKHASLVTEADVEHVKHELITGANALTADKFDNLVNSGDTSDDAIQASDALTVLKAIAAGSRTGPCPRAAIACETVRPADEILDDLVKREVVEVDRDLYFHIRVGLFREWLRARA